MCFPPKNALTAEHMCFSLKINYVSNAKTLQTSELINLIILIKPNHQHFSKLFKIVINILYLSMKWSIKLLKSSIHIC